MLDDAIAQFGQLMNKPAFAWCKMLPASQLLYAQFVSATLSATGNKRSFPLQRLSTHTHACNFVTPTGVIVALVTPRHGNGPFHIVIPAPLPRQLREKEGASGWWQGDTIAFGTLHIKLAHAATWPPLLPALLQLTSKVPHLLHEITRMYPPSPLVTDPSALTQRAQQGMAYLQIGITQHDSAQVHAGVISLAGLGPGLTPAGDDFLVGLLAALHASRSGALMEKDELSNLCRLIAETAASSTTRLSAAWLRYAGQGCFGNAWHHLINALNHNSADAITAAAHRVLTTGASSGVDAMSGFLFGVTLLQRINDR